MDDGGRVFIPMTVGWRCTWLHPCNWILLSLVSTIIPRPYCIKYNGGCVALGLQYKTRLDLLAEWSSLFSDLSHHPTCCRILYKVLFGKPLAIRSGSQRSSIAKGFDLSVSVRMLMGSTKTIMSSKWSRGHAFFYHVHHMALTRALLDKANKFHCFINDFWTKWAWIHFLLH